MSRQALKGLLALVAVIVVLGSSKGAEALRQQRAEAVVNLKAGWKQQLAYQHQLVFPSMFAIHESGAVLVGDGATFQVQLLGAEGNLQPYADLSSAPGGLRTVAYQRGKERLLVFGVDGGLYTYGGDGQYSLLTTFSEFDVGSVAVASDDSVYIFAVTENGGSFRRFDADGAGEVVFATVTTTNALMALDDANGKLYFSDAVAGTVNELDVSSTPSTPVVIASGVGIPGTSEPVAVGVAGDGHLYAYPVGGGLSRYDRGAIPTWTLIIPGSTGGGAITWSPAHQAFLQGHLGGANIVAFDPAAATTRIVTPPFNARAVVENDQGKILACSEADPSFVQIVSNSGYKHFSDALPAACATLERTPSGTTFLGLGNGQVMTLSPSGKATFWATTGITSGTYLVAYDAANAALVAMSRAPQGSKIVRIFEADPAGPSQQFELTGVFADAGAVDVHGNIYILDIEANAISKVANGSQAAVLLVADVLSSRAITAPAMEYLSVEDALVVSTITNYELWPLANPARHVLADNAGAVDNLTVNETGDGGVVAVHSGQAFRLIPPGKVHK